MAKILMIGLTESGKATKINEDTFLCDGRIYPDMLTGSEEQTVISNKYHQLYMVAGGFGGPGAGDLASRLVLSVGKQMFNKIDEYKNPEFDFQTYAQDFIAEVDTIVKEQVSAKHENVLGASFAMLLIDANNCYLLNLGNTSINLFRNNKIYNLSEAAGEEKNKQFIGNIKSDKLPLANTINKYTLEPGDVFVLATSGFNSNYCAEDLSSDLARPDAFAASIRQAQIHSGKLDPQPNRTVVAVKAIDLQLEPPSRLSEEEDKITYSEIYNSLDDVKKAERMKRKANNNMNNSLAHEEHVVQEVSAKDKAAVFFKSLLLGFLVGLAILLIIWFFIL